MRHRAERVFTPSPPAHQGSLPRQRSVPEGRSKPLTGGEVSIRRPSVHGRLGGLSSPCASRSGSLGRPLIALAPPPSRRLNSEPRPLTMDQGLPEFMSGRRRGRARPPWVACSHFHLADRWGNVLSRHQPRGLHRTPSSTPEHPRDDPCPHHWRIRCSGVRRRPEGLVECTLVGPRRGRGSESRSAVDHLEGREACCKPDQDPSQRSRCRSPSG